MSCGGCRGFKSIGSNSQAPVPSKTAPTYNPEDSSIIFPEGMTPMDIDGYSVDPEDSQRLVSEMPTCGVRMTGVMLQQDGTYLPHHHCLGACEHKGSQVDLAKCNACPLANALPD